MPYATDAQFREAYRRARTRVSDASGIKTQPALLGRKFNFRRQPTAAAAVRREETFRRLAAARPPRRAGAAGPEPGVGNGESGRALLGCITGFDAATKLPPAGARRAGDAERRRRILAAVGAVVEYAAERWPTTGGDIDGDLARAAREWEHQNRTAASVSRLACRLTWRDWPGRQEAGQPPGSGGSGIPRQPRPGFVPPTGGHAIESAAAASRRRRRS